MPSFDISGGSIRCGKAYLPRGVSTQWWLEVTGTCASGQVSRTREELKAQIETFWRYVGSNMRDPKWVWGNVFVDRLGDDAAVLTATWSIPHIAPTGHPHVIRGAWTAVFRRITGKWMIVAEHLSVPTT